MTISERYNAAAWARMIAAQEFANGKSWADYFRRRNELLGIEAPDHASQGTGPEV